MTKLRILAALDASESGFTAGRVACDLAWHTPGELTAAGIVDTAWITAPRAVPIGASAYKAHRDAVVLDETRQRVAELLADFRRQAEASGLAVRTTIRDGTPWEIIEEEAQDCDLVVTGRTANFHFEAVDGVGGFVTRLIRDDPRPVIVVPPAHHPSPTALVAFDGSFGAARAVHMFCLLGLARNRDITAMSIVAGDAALAEARAETAGRLLRRYGARVAIEGVALDGHPGDILCERAHALGAGLMVMGAYGTPRLRDLFLGSCTRRLLRDSPIPLFVHH